MTIYYEDIEVGETWKFGTYHVTEKEIIEFAKKYDPLPFHVDPARGKESIYGGLIASGWHTTSIWERMTVDTLFENWAVMGSPGVDALRWRNPVRPGDTLSVRWEVTGKEMANPARGTIDGETVMTNQDDETVLTMITHVLIATRNSERESE